MSKTKKHIDVYEYVDNAPDYAEETAALWSWSLNCEYPTPFTLFMDLIGYSEEHFGEALVKDTTAVGLGYVEQSYLADAMKEYSNRPRDIEDWITELLEIETR